MLFKFFDYLVVRRTCTRLVACAAFALALSLTVAGTANLALAGPSGGDGHRVAAANPTGQLEWQEQKLKANGAGPSDLYGASVAVVAASSGGPEVAFIGAPSADSTRGAVYVFTNSNGVWKQAGKLTANDGTLFSRFGAAVASDGPYVMIGAPGASSSANPIVEQGAVYLFKKSGNSWDQAAEFTAGVHLSKFGAAVDFGTNGGFGRAIVGAPGANDAGAAYIFTLDNGTWTQTAKLSPPPGGGGGFGSAVMLGSFDVFVGAPSANGVVYFYKNNGGGRWQMKQAIQGPGPFLSGFGSAISPGPNGSILIGAPSELISAPGSSSSAPVLAGAVYNYDESGGVWTQEQTLAAADATQGMAFGSSIASSRHYAVIGAPGDKYTAVPGAVYVFYTNDDGNWVQKQKLTASDGADENRFGAAVAMPPVFLSPAFVAGAPGARDGKGSAYAYAASELSLTVSAPASVTQNGSYVSEVIVTNSGSATSAPITVTAAQPAGADFVSVTAVTQGSKFDCQGKTGTGVICTFSPIPAVGTAKVDITWKATGNAGTTITNTASLPKETPPLTANATTTIASAPPPPPPPPPHKSGGGGSFGWLALAALLALAGVGFRRRHG